MDKIFGSINNVFGIANDIIVAGWSEDGSDQDDALTRVLECARKNVKFNDDKLVFRQKQLLFFRHIIGEDGVSPDPEKVAAFRRQGTTKFPRNGELFAQVFTPPVRADSTAA